MMRALFKFIMLLVTVAVIFQFFFRYKMIEVDTYVIKDDRLTLKIYAKHKDSSDWRVTRFKSLSHAIVYFEEGILTEKTFGKKFSWWDEE